MPTISVNLAAADLSAERGSFLSHSHWLRAFTTLAGFNRSPIGGTARVLRELASAAAAFPVPNAAASDASEALACLNRAWGTELVLRSAAQYANEDELIRLTNSWGAVQAYYAAYGATQALIAAEGHARPTSHPATQTMYVDLWSARGASIPPWTFAIGSKADRRAQPDGTLNGPGRALNAVSGLSSCTAENCWELAAQALRSTREDDHKAARKRATTDEVKQRHRDWNAEETERLASGQKPPQHPIWWDQTPRLSADRRVAIDKRLRPYTVLDYLYRLRLKANAWTHACIPTALWINPKRK